MEQDPKVPPHRIMVRTLLGGLLGGAAGMISGCALGVAAEGPSPSVLEALGVGAVVLLGFGVWCGLLVFGRELAMHVSAPLRYGVPCLIAPLLLLFVTAAGFWLVGLFSGKGPGESLADFLAFFSMVWENDADRATGMTLTSTLALPFLALSSLHLIERSTWFPRALRWHLLVGGCSGFASVASYALSMKAPSGWLIAMLLIVPMACAVGLYLADAWEPRLVDWWRARREAE